MLSWDFYTFFWIVLFWVVPDSSCIVPFGLSGASGLSYIVLIDLWGVFPFQRPFCNIVLVFLLQSLSVWRDVWFVSECSWWKHILLCLDVCRKLLNSRCLLLFPLCAPLQLIEVLADSFIYFTILAVYSVL